MNLIKIRNALETVLPLDGALFTVMRADKTLANAERSLTLFRRAEGANNLAVGGVLATGYVPMYLSLLLRWGTNTAEAEAKALELHSFIRLGGVELDGFLCPVMALFAEPVALGADDKGVYEFSMDFNMWHILRG